MKSILFLFTFLLLLSSCGGLKEVRLEQIGKVSNFQKDGKRMTADVALTIKNDNNFPIVMKPSNLDILLNESPVGVAFLNKKVKFKKNSTEEYIANVSFENQGINAIDLLKVAFSNQINIRFKGKVKAGNGFISKKFPVDEVKSFHTSDLMNWIK